MPAEILTDQGTNFMSQLGVLSSAYSQSAPARTTHKQMGWLSPTEPRAKQAEQKVWYDRNARVREFELGEEVLVLLPTSTSKLLARLQGPYRIVWKVGRVNYEIEMSDKKKRKEGD